MKFGDTWSVPPAAWAALMSLAALTLLLLPWPVLMSARGVERLRGWVEGRPARSVALAALLLAPFLLYYAAPGVTTPAAALGLLAYVLVPAGLAAALPLGRAGAVGDVLVVLAIWLPSEMKWLAGAFPWPRGGSGHMLVSPLGVDLLLLLMLVARRFDATGFTLRLGGRDAVRAAGAFVVFAAAGIPIGLSTGFLTYGVRAEGALPVLAGGAVIFLFTAVPEEVLFRGFIQGLLDRRMGRSWPALGLASLIFGASHLNNGPTAPDWRYFVLATLAGVAYGWVYRRTRRILAPALTHALVDLTWSVFLKG